MDAISKSIFAVTAAALCVIAFKLCSTPTLGDLIALKDIKGGEEKSAERLRILRSIPLVQVHGGDIDAKVTGEVSIDGTVSVE